MHARTTLLAYVVVFLATRAAPAQDREPAKTARAEGAQKPVKVFILAGQSNMEGKAKVSLLEYQAQQPATRALFQHLRKDGKWIERDDVWIKYLGDHGKLTVGYGSPKCIGPELEFGNVIGDHYGKQILLIKVAWGGRSLFRDFRSPSAGLPASEVLARLLAEQKKRKPETTLDDVKKSFGASYRAMFNEVNGTLSRLQALFPGYAGQGCEIAGFVWFQGWNDMISADYTAEYTANLAHFIRDVRKDLRAPRLPFVIGEMGVDGLHPNAAVKRFKEAQAALLTRAEFQGNVALVKTDVFWDKEAEAVFKKGWRQHLEEWNKVGSDYPYHYLGSPRTMCQIGRAFGEAMLQLRARQ
jgi:alpha-galactosidase